MSETADIDAGFVPYDNRHLVVHEYPGFESGCDRNNLDISEFIERRTGDNFSMSERLHAVWLRCHIRDGSNESLMKTNLGYVFQRQMLLQKTLEME